MLEKHRRQLINRDMISFQPSFLIQELDHHITEPIRVLCAKYALSSFTRLGSFILIILIRELAGHQLCRMTYSLTVVGKHDGKWKATLILYSLGKFLHLNTKESPHFYPIGSPISTKCFLSAVISRGRSL